MLRPGLVSVTFRKLQPREIAALASRAGLSVIEWGGDIHVPHGDKARAREVRGMTRDAGLEVASYGSYYTLGSANGPRFESVVETAAELEAPIVRVWAGERGATEADEAYWNLIVDDGRRIAGMAGSRGMLVAFEFHQGTLTDSAGSARRLLARCGHASLRTYWQPSTALDADANAGELAQVLPWLANLHVYQIGPDQQERLPLSTGEAPWKRFLVAAASTGRDHCAMLEFVGGDSPEVMLQDAQTLLRWITAQNAGRTSGPQEDA